MGSICDARLAGKYPATVATASKTITVPKNEAGSYAFTPNNSYKSWVNGQLDRPVVFGQARAGDAGAKSDR
jgi:hypothetical protein